MIKKLIDMGADVNYAFKNLQRNPPLQSLFHSSLLSFSILLGNAEAAKILIQANANIGTLSFFLFIYFLISFSISSFFIFFFCVVIYCYLDGNINREISLIEFATQMGNPGVLRAIIEKKKERVKDPEALLEELLKIWEKRIETIESEPRFDTLSLASFFGYTHVVEWFLSLSNYQHNFTPFGLSPLHLAVLGGHKEIVEILLRDRKWSVQKYFSGTLAYDAPGIWGLSPFHIAAHMGNYSLVNIFINHNPEPYILPEPFEVENFDCRSPLDMAAMQGHTKIVKLLIPQLSSPDHPLSIPTSELVPQLMELANRAKLDGAPSLLLMAMKEKNVVLANILHGGKYPLLEPGDSSEWMKEFFHPLSTGELETNTKSDNNSGFLPNHSTSAKVYLPNFLHGLPIPSRTTSYNSRGLFTLAAHLGDMELIKKWKPNKTRQMNTPLYVTARYIAALQGHESVVMNLASLDESQVMDDDERKYALEYAAGGGHFQLTSNLLKLGSPALLNYALLAACFRGNIAVVNLLLDNGANLESFNKIRVKNSYFCGNALQAAAYRGNLELVRELLARGAKVDASVGADQLTKPTPGEWGALGVNKLSEFVAVTALHIALDYRHEVVAIELIQAGAKTKIDNNPLEATSLFFACKRGLTEVVKICLERDNYHPLVFRHMLAVAAFHGHLDVAKELMNRVDLTEDELRDPFPFAVAGGNVEIVKMMLERGSKISSITQVAKMVLRGCVTKSINDTIPFFIPVQKGNVEMVELLLDNGVEVDLKDSKGYCTALMYAASIQSSTGNY